jgi:hypothetical protein
LLFHKATEGLTFVDPRYQARRAAWMNGIPVPVTDVTGEILQITPRFAAYHFFHGEDPEAEAEFFLSTRDCGTAMMPWSIGRPFLAADLSRVQMPSTGSATWSRGSLASRSLSIQGMPQRSRSGRGSALFEAPFMAR